MMSLIFDGAIPQLYLESPFLHRDLSDTGYGLAPGASNRKCSRCAVSFSLWSRYNKHFSMRAHERD